MTISNQVVKRVYQADGSTRAWEVDFPVRTGASVAAFVTDASGNVTQVTEHFSWDGQNHLFTYPTLESGESPLAIGASITLIRQTPLTQQTDLVRQDAWDAEVLEEGYDKLTCLAQELNEKFSRAVKIPVGKTGETNAENFVTATSLSAALSTKQDTLSAAQQNAVNSGITSALVSKITSNESAISSLQTSKLDASTASATYLTQDDAATNYLTKTDAASLYLTQTNAAENYLSKADGASLYLTQSSASSTYATQSALSAGLGEKQNSLTAAQLAAVNSGATADVVAQVQSNKTDIAALDAELEENRVWQKPSSWVDLRSGALPNSVYLLAAHSADYATYPTLTVYAEVSDSSTYDVYVDGIKKASAVSSGTATTLSWETLALATGYDVTYPAALRTHIVRITPTDGTKTITRINNNDGNATVMTGVLWAHFTTENYILLRYAFLNLSHLEAVTAKSDMLNVSNIYHTFNGCSELKTVPTFNGKNQQYIDAQSAFLGCAKLQKISFEDFITYRACYGMFKGCSALKKISMKNSAVKMWDEMFSGCAKLESLPDLENGSANAMAGLLSACTSLKENVLDLSGETSLTKLSIGATSTNRVDGLKGVIVSSSAPFSASPFVDVSYTGLERPALVALFDSLPTVSDSQVCTVTGCTGAADLTADDRTIATAKGWTVTR